MISPLLPGQVANLVPLFMEAAERKFLQLYETGQACCDGWTLFLIKSETQCLVQTLPMWNSEVSFTESTGDGLVFEPPGLYLFIML